MWLCCPIAAALIYNMENVMHTICADSSFDGHCDMSWYRPNGSDAVLLLGRSGISLASVTDSVLYPPAGLNGLEKGDDHPAYALHWSTATCGKLPLPVDTLTFPYLF